MLVALFCDNSDRKAGSLEIMSQYTREEIIEMVRRGESLAGADLSGADLGADLRGATTRMGADLSKADLGGANLVGANLALVNLSKANLERANLPNVNLLEANLEEANLREAVLTNSLLSNANLRKANLRKANLWFAYLLHSNLVGANLMEASLNRATLEKADLSGANLRGVELYSAVLNKADLSGADITGVNIWGIACTGWKIEGIKTEYVYYCSTPWDKEVKEKTRRDFRPGEFEALFKSLPTIEMVFDGGLSPLDYVKLVGLTEIIRREKPDMNLEVKAMEKVGLDTILRFTLSRDEDLEEAVRLIAQLSQERDLNQKLLPILDKQGIQLKTEPDQPAFKDCNIGKVVVNLISASGEPSWRGEMGDIVIGSQHISGGNVAIGSGAVANYNANKTEVDDLLAKLRAELQEDKQALTEALTEALAANEQDKVPGIWEQIKGGIITSSAAYNIITTLSRVLGLPV